MLVRTTSRDRCTFPLSYLVPARRKQEALPKPPAPDHSPGPYTQAIFYYLHFSPLPLHHIFEKVSAQTNHRQEHTPSPLGPFSNLVSLTTCEKNITTTSILLD